MLHKTVLPAEQVFRAIDQAVEKRVQGADPREVGVLNVRGLTPIESWIGGGSDERKDAH